LYPGARTALLATKGFRDILEIGRGNRTLVSPLSTLLTSP
jgi:N-methylhydantoinase A/oxoprolinase/acetone carboxylase beta subunit